MVKNQGSICYIGLPNMTMEQIKRWAAQQFPGEMLAETRTPFDDERAELRGFLDGRLKGFTFAIARRNTPFGCLVLEAVSVVPYGGTATYGDIARQIHRPGAARAVGRAVGANPLPLVIPCHRIVGSDGSLTGYGGGLPLKKKLLAMEARNA